MTPSNATSSAGDVGRKPSSRPGFFPKPNTQAADLLAALINVSRQKDGWLTLPGILRLGIAKYATVITELRDLGWTIVCRDSWTYNPITKRSMFATAYHIPDKEWLSVWGVVLKPKSSARGVRPANSTVYSVQ